MTCLIKILGSLIPLTTFLLATEKPYLQLEPFPQEVWYKIAQSMKPSDVLSFQETCKTARGDLGIRMMTIASMNYPVFLDWEFYSVSVGDVSDDSLGRLLYIQGHSLSWREDAILLSKPWQVLSDSVCQLLGFHTPFEEKLINIYKSGVQLFDLTLSHIDAQNLSLIVPYLKNVRSLKFKFSGQDYKMTSKHLELLSNNKENLSQLISIKIDSAEELSRSALDAFRKDFDVFDPIGYDTYSTSVFLIRKRGKMGYAK